MPTAGTLQAWQQMGDEVRSVNAELLTTHIYLETVEEETQTAAQRMSEFAERMRMPDAAMSGLEGAMRMFRGFSFVLTSTATSAEDLQNKMRGIAATQGLLDILAGGYQAGKNFMSILVGMGVVTAALGATIMTWFVGPLLIVTAAIAGVMYLIGNYKRKAAEKIKVDREMAQATHEMNMALEENAHAYHSAIASMAEDKDKERALMGEWARTGVEAMRLEVSLAGPGQKIADQMEELVNLTEEEKKLFVDLDRTMEQAVQKGERIAAAKQREIEAAKAVLQYNREQLKTQEAQRDTIADMLRDERQRITDLKVKLGMMNPEEQARFQKALKTPASQRSIAENEMVLEYTAGSPAEDQVKQEIAKRGEGMFRDMQAAGLGDTREQELEQALQQIQGTIAAQREANKEILASYGEMEAEYKNVRDGLAKLKLARQQEKANNG